MKTQSKDKPVTGKNSAYIMEFHIVYFGKRTLGDQRPPHSVTWLWLAIPTPQSLHFNDWPSGIVRKFSTRTASMSASNEQHALVNREVAEFPRP